MVLSTAALWMRLILLAPFSLCSDRAIIATITGRVKSGVAEQLSPAGVPGTSDFSACHPQLLSVLGSISTHCQDKNIAGQTVKVSCPGSQLVRGGEGMIPPEEAMLLVSLSTASYKPVSL